ncbi:putative AAA+ ATPase domain, pigment precursor permease/Protein ATP-binding cassette sub-family G [Helianthus annuus]|nr:putative AAA+ ATPase domain, pigment precursor permease/Protein ATP-binding cassette sub-family G [Helianthus annuus]
MASCLNPSTVEDDSAALFTASDDNSPDQSTSPSSSSHRSLPPPYPSKPSYKLTVKNLSYTIKTDSQFTLPWLLNNPNHINILKSVSFVAQSSEIMAIVGPSGSGKSSLLHFISGRVRNNTLDPKTTISLNDFPITSPSQMKKICGFVAQEDNLLPLLTVKETLMYSAKFRLKEMSSKEKEERVECLIRELGLVHVRDSFVGDEDDRGISGGERKRVSIGVDMIPDPPILLLDEPTSGLDSSSALQVIELLSNMARSKQRTIILSIHQPSYRVLQYISNFLILSNGSVVHNGSLDSLEETINELGFEIPTQLNALEFSMEIKEVLETSYNRKEPVVTFGELVEPSFATVWAEQTNGTFQELLRRDQSVERSRYKHGLHEILILCTRFWKTIYRTKQLFLARTMQAVVGGLGLGSVYVNVKNNENGIAERLGLFAFSLSFLLSSTVEALPIFLQERRVLMKEASRGAYKTSSYMIANTIVFLPFLFVVGLLFAIPVYWLVGLNPSFMPFAFFVFVVWLIVLMASSLVLFLSAVSPDFISGNSLICTVLGAFFLFSGYFIPKEVIPKYWMFMYYVSLYRYPLDSWLVNEYWGRREVCFSQEGPGSTCSITGKDILKGRGLESDTRWMNVGIMFGFFVFYRVLCWIILSRKVSKTTI